MVSGVVGALLILALPTGIRTSSRGRATSCMNRLNQLGKGFIQYLNDNDDVMFSISKTGDEAWPNLMQRKYVQGWKAFRSPFDQSTDIRPLATSDASGTVPISYGINSSLFDTNKGDWRNEPSKLLFAAPALQKTPGPPLKWQPDAFSNQNCRVLPGGTGNFGTHGGRSDLNVLFADGHTESMSCTKFADDSTQSGKTRWYPQ